MVRGEVLCLSIYKQRGLKSYAPVRKPNAAGISALMSLDLFTKCYAWLRYMFVVEVPQITHALSQVLKCYCVKKNNKVISSYPNNLTERKKLLCACA
jgi:hypothetical protein